MGMDYSRVISWVRSQVEKHDNSLPSEASQNHKSTLRKYNLLEAVKRDNSLPSDTTRKRKRTASDYLASPPVSFEGADLNNAMPSTPKKRRLGSVDMPDDLEITSRPGARSFPSSSASMSYSQTTSETGSRARVSSSKKKMMSLSLSETVEYESIWMETKPEAADSLLQTMDDFGRRLKIIPYSLRQTIAQKLKDRNRMTEYETKWDSCFKSEGIPEDHLPGRIPSLEEIERILRKARKLYKHKHEEAAWNGHVYLQLLESIFEDPLTGQCSDFNATTW